MDRVIHISSFVEKTVTLANTRVIFFLTFLKKEFVKKF